jgi:hypothetical protein
MDGMRNLRRPRRMESVSYSKMKESKRNAVIVIVVIVDVVNLQPWIINK